MLLLESAEWESASERVVDTMAPLDDDDDDVDDDRRKESGGGPSTTNAGGDAIETALTLTLDAPRVASDEESLAPLLSEATTGGVSSDEEAVERRASAREVFSEHGRTLGAFAVTLVVTTMSMSVPFPFLSQEFAKAKLSPGCVGIVFASLPFGVLVVSPHAPRLMWRYGPLRVAKWSLLGQAGAVLCTTLAGRTRWQLWMICRLILGFFNAATSVTMLCVVTRAVPEAVALASGLQEVAAGFGTLLGPIFGGFLFDIGHSPTLPLIANGAAILAVIPPVMRIMRSIETDIGSSFHRVEDESASKPSYSRILRHPTFLASALAELVVSTSFGGIPTTLPLFLKQTLDFSPSKIGVVYALLAGLYAVVTPVIGMMSHDSKLGDMALCTIGCAAMSAAHLLFGPSKLLDLPDLSESARRRLCVWTASVIYGIGSAFAFVPLLPIQQASVKGEGPRAADSVNGIFLSVYFLGEMMGQLCGSSLVHEMGYPAASTFWAFAIIASASGLVVIQFGAALASKYKKFKTAVQSSFEL